MKKPKRKKPSKSKFRNPEENWFNSNFIPLLIKNLIHKPNFSEISLLMNYKNGGNYCRDCNQYLEICTCEGSRDVSGDVCEDCKQRYCVCGIIPNRRFIMDLAFSVLSNHQLYLFRKELLFKLSDLTLNDTQARKISRSIHEIELFLDY